MHEFNINIACTAASALLLTALPLGAQETDSAAALEKLRSENFRLRLENRELRNELERLKGQSSASGGISSLDGNAQREQTGGGADFFSLADSWDSLTEREESAQETSAQASCGAFDVPHDGTYDKYIDIYALQRRKNMTAILARYDAHRPMIEEAFSRRGVPAELSVLCIIESAANPRALSKAGAAGLWQLRADTASDCGLTVSLLTDERFNARKSTDAAARFLKALGDEFGDWRIALMAYNCGPGTMRRALAKCGNPCYAEVLPLLPRETREYLPALAAAREVAENRAKYDF